MPFQEKIMIFNIINPQVHIAHIRNVYYFDTGPVRFWTFSGTDATFLRLTSSDKQRLENGGNQD